MKVKAYSFVLFSSLKAAPTVILVRATIAAATERTICTSILSILQLLLLLSRSLETHDGKISWNFYLLLKLCHLACSSCHGTDAYPIWEGVPVIAADAKQSACKWASLLVSIYADMVFQGLGLGLPPIWLLLFDFQLWTINLVYSIDCHTQSRWILLWRFPVFSQPLSELLCQSQERRQQYMWWLTILTHWRTPFYAWHEYL